MKGGFFRVLGQCFTGKIGAAARREWDADGAFCRGIPGFSAQARVRRDGSAHGGQRRGGRGEKIFKKGVENLKIGMREGSEGGAGALYIGCAR